METPPRPHYELAECQIRQLKHGNYVRAQLENVGGDFPINLRIGNDPSIQLNKEQMSNIAKALQMDETVQLAVRHLEENVIRGDYMIRKTLIKMFERDNA